ncbi:MAG: hypothetical protein WCJ84_05480 [Candidatus Peregrinibacteria bacterium]
MWRHFAFWGLLITLLLSWSAWGIVYTKVSPIESPAVAFPAFYATLFFALSSSFALFGALSKKVFSPARSSFSCLQTSVRQGIIMGVIALIALGFQQFSLFNAIVAILLLLMAVFVEAFFWEKK